MSEQAAAQVSMNDAKALSRAAATHAEWLAIPRDRKTLRVGRLCVILSLTVLLVIVSQTCHGSTPRVAASETPSR